MPDCWENEAHLALDELGRDQAELVVPSISILAEPPVAVVDRNVDKHATRDVAEAYLKYLYSPQGQTLAARRYYRPVQSDAVPAELLKKFADLKLFTIDEVFGRLGGAQSSTSTTEPSLTKSMCHNRSDGMKMSFF